MDLGCWDLKLDTRGANRLRGCTFIDISHRKIRPNVWADGERWTGDDKYTELQLVYFLVTVNDLKPRGHLPNLFLFFYDQALVHAWGHLHKFGSQLPNKALIHSHWQADVLVGEPQAVPVQKEHASPTVTTGVFSKFNRRLVGFGGPPCWNPLVYRLGLSLLV